MNVLALDTCFDCCSVAAGRGVRSLTPAICFLTETMVVGHAERLMPMIESAMADAKLAFSNLDRIAVTNGPGTFAGTRISVAAARAFALATGAEIVAYSSLNLMAMSPRIPAARGRRLAVATDARRGEVYFQEFDRHFSTPLSAPIIIEIETAAAALAGRPMTIAGSGAAALAEAARNGGLDADAILPDLLPDAIDMLFAAGETRTTNNVAPIYMRPPDAKPPRAASLAGVAG
jgi:tRNA threonylcarbamoyladenosine biosynthesis protein TsaB